jgi:hypothetical protein
VIVKLRKRRNAAASDAPEPTAEELLAEIEALSEENRSARDPERERRIVHLRQLAGLALQAETEGKAELVEPDHDALPPDTELPEVSAEALTAGLVRAAIFWHGGIIVRGLLEPGEAAALTEEVDRGAAAVEAARDGHPDTEGYFQEMQQLRPMTFRVPPPAGVLAMDSPRIAFQVLELFARSGVIDLAARYLGQPPVISSHKTTLRKTHRDHWAGWHQDARPLGGVEALNLWITLSHCGDTAPGLDLVPRRMHRLVPPGDPFGEGLDRDAVPHETAEWLAGEAGIRRPIFEPGDAMFFDGLYLHRTASEPDMPDTRNAVECWFFAPGEFPEDYIPLAP